MNARMNTRTFLVFRLLDGVLFSLEIYFVALVLK